jgi:hypothetical protein
MMFGMWCVQLVLKKQGVFFLFYNDVWNVVCTACVEDIMKISIILPQPGRISPPPLIQFRYFPIYWMPATNIWKYYILNYIFMLNSTNIFSASATTIVHHARCTLHIV